MDHPCSRATTLKIHIPVSARNWNMALNNRPGREYKHHKNNRTYVGTPSLSYIFVSFYKLNTLIIE